MEKEYPYPTIDDDGYEFDLIEQIEVEGYGFELPDFPSDDDRFSVQPGSLVKLIFRYRESVEKNDQTFTTERMWVEFLENRRTHLVGRLDNNPTLTDIFSEDALVSFHPKHIVQIWKE